MTEILKFIIFLLVMSSGVPALLYMQHGSLGKQQKLN